MQLVVPKVHVEKLHQIEDPAILQDIMVLTHSVADRLVSKLGATEYNILQNNGRSAHQVPLAVSIHMWQSFYTFFS